jgi:hypothetical protein
MGEGPSGRDKKNKYSRDRDLGGVSAAEMRKARKAQFKGEDIAVFLYYICMKLCGRIHLARSHILYSNGFLRPPCFRSLSF